MERGRLDFKDKAGKWGYVRGEAGTNFGLRIDAEEAARLLDTHGNDLPWDIMAAAYGDDSDWCGLTTDDLVEEGHRDEDGTPELKDPEGWAPYELDGIGAIRPATEDDIVAAGERGYAIDLSRMSAKAALSVIQRWTEAVDHVPQYVDAAMRRVEHVVDNAYWGVCGECDDDIESHLWHNNIEHTFSQSEA